MERDITIRLVKHKMPDQAGGVIVQEGKESYLIIINDQKSEQEQAAAFLHECLHIWHNDFSTNTNALEVEELRHRELAGLADLLG